VTFGTRLFHVKHELMLDGWPGSSYHDGMTNTQQLPTGPACKHFWTTEGIVSEEFAVKDDRPVWEQTEGGIPNYDWTAELVRPVVCFGCGEADSVIVIWGGEAICRSCEDDMARWEDHANSDRNSRYYNAV